jgi:hypothetical protein
MFCPIHSRQFNSMHHVWSIVDMRGYPEGPPKSPHKRNLAELRSATTFERKSNGYGAYLFGGMRVVDSSKGG